MTLNWLKDQNIQFSHASQGNIDTYKIKGKQQYKKIHSIISGDFTSASYLIAASVLIPGKVIVEGLAMSDPQGDKRLVTLLQEMGADIIVESKRLIIRGGKKLSGIKIDANDIPDLLPTLAVIGVYASGKTEIRNVEQARIKETDRIHSMADGLRRMGAKIDEHQDGLTVYQSLLLGCSVKGCNDHRTVMALSIAGMIAEGITIIEDGEAIKKTFPGFIKIMQSLGAKLEVENVIST
jgi:3-phosphoshikimate 1-carboxyvinyltransferase